MANPTLEVRSYSINLERMTGSAQILCPSDQDTRSRVTTPDDTLRSVNYAGLQEYSNYTIYLSVRYLGVNNRLFQIYDNFTFTTLSAS